jgi:polyhydroxybutyrate depolymerase
VTNRRSLRGIVCAIALAAVSLAAAPAPRAVPPSRALPADDDPIFGTGDQRVIRSVGHVRTYRVFHPGSAGPQPPLVVMLHAESGTAQNAQDAFGWDRLAGPLRFVVAYPEGIGRSWNAGRCCGLAQARNVDDVRFLTSVIRDVMRRDRVDPHRIYVAGFGNGAMMAYRLACEGPVRLAAIGAVAGALEVPCSAPAAPVSVMAIHGAHDDQVPFGGGVGDGAIVRIEHPSVEVTLARWRRTDRCPPSEISRGGGVQWERAECAGGTGVVLAEIFGGLHRWPGIAYPAMVLARQMGSEEQYWAVDATKELWAFFKGRAVQQ